MMYSHRNVRFHWPKNYVCHYLIYVVYTEDEICEIQEKEANKWKNYIKEKDNIINILKSRESLLKFVLYVLNKREIDNKVTTLLTTTRYEILFF